MAKANPAFRGIYTYDADFIPTGPEPLERANPKFRGIYAYDVEKAPDGNPDTPPIAPD